MTPVGPDRFNGARDGLKARRREGDLSPRSHVEHAFGHEERERVSERHDAIVAVGRLLDHLATNSLEEATHLRRSGKVGRGGAKHGPHRALGAGQADRTEERVGAAPGDPVTERFAQRGGGPHLDAAHVEHDLRRAQVRAKLRGRGAHLRHGDRENDERGSFDEARKRVGRHVVGNDCVRVVRAMGDPTLRQELPERAPEAPVPDHPDDVFRHEPMNLPHRGAP